MIDIDYDCEHFIDLAMSFCEKNIKGLRVAEDGPRTFYFKQIKGNSMHPDNCELHYIGDEDGADLVPYNNDSYFTEYCNEMHQQLIDEQKFNPRDL